MLRELIAPIASKWIIPILSATSVSTATVAIHPGLRSWVRDDLFAGKEREVHAVLEFPAAYRQDGIPLTIAKVATQQGLQLEIWRNLAAGSPELLETIDLGPVKDTLFRFGSNVSSLALRDLDHDGRPELIVPVLDRNLAGRLRVFDISRSEQGGGSSLHLRSIQ